MQRVLSHICVRVFHHSFCHFHMCTLCTFIYYALYIMLYILCSGIVHQNISLLFMCITFCFCRRANTFKTFAERERGGGEKLFKILFKLHMYCDSLFFFSSAFLSLSQHPVHTRVSPSKNQTRQSITIVYLWLSSSSMTQIRESKLYWD